MVEGDGEAMVAEAEIWDGVPISDRVVVFARGRREGGCHRRCYCPVAAPPLLMLLLLLVGLGLQERGAAEAPAAADR